MCAKVKKGRWRQRKRWQLKGKEGGVQPLPVVACSSELLTFLFVSVSIIVQSTGEA